MIHTQFKEYGGCMMNMMHEKFSLESRRISLLVILALATILSLTPSICAAKQQKIPFVGMSMVYSAVGRYGEAEIRTVSVLSYDEDNNKVIVRDSHDRFDVMEVDLGTREVVRHTGSWPFKLYIEHWIPTKIKKSSYVKILNTDAVVVGSTVMRVDDRDIQVWELRFSYQLDDGVNGQNTWYYDKNTGLWVAAAWVEWDNEGNVIGSWGGHLMSTNVVLERK
jgi:hypothetical protein